MDILETLSSADDPESPPDPGETRSAMRKPVRRTVFLALAVGFLAILLGGAGLAAAYVSTMVASIPRDPSLLPVAAPGEARRSVPAVPGEPVDFVIMGSDSRGEDQGRSDVLVLAHLNAARDKVYLVSFPRDMYVEIPGHGSNKINAAYAFGGSALTVRTLESLLDVSAEHVALIDFEGFVSLSDTIGGVTLWNRVDSSSRGYDFPRGELKLSGEELLVYARQRHGLPRGDLDRAERHRTVLKAMVDKLATPEVLSNPLALAEITGKLDGFLTVDEGLTNERLWELASGLRISGGDDIVGLQAPISGFGTSPAGASIDIVDTKELGKLADALRNDTMEEYVASRDVVDSE